MSAKLCVGLQKKVGMPDYGSLGANCHIEIDIEPTLLDDLESFHERARRGFAACKQAVHDQLLRQQSSATQNGAASQNGQRNGQTPSTNGNGHYATQSPANTGHATGVSNGNGNHNGANQRPLLATVSQARAIRAIAKRQEIDLDRLLGQRFRLMRPEDLTIRDASILIDELKAPANY